MKNTHPNDSIFDITIRLVILALIIAWCFLIVHPFANIIMWSIILALAIYPLHSILTKKLGNRPKIASFIIVFSMLVIIFLPVGLMIAQLMEEVKEIRTIYQDGTLAIPPPTEKVKDWPFVGEKFYALWQSTSSNLEQTILKYKEELLGVGKKIVTGLLSAAGGIVQIIIALIIAGILLVVGGTGEMIHKFFGKLAGARGDEFADVTMKTVANVVKGILGVALILAILHGIILLLAGIPYAGIWTLIIFVLGVLQIPLFFVTLPIIIYIFAHHDTTTAIIWTILFLIAGFSDNILRPILLGQGAPVPMVVIFIGVIGGFMFTGFIGLFTGAIVFSIGYKLFIGWINSGTSPTS